MLKAIVFDLDGTLTVLTLPLEAMRRDAKKYYIDMGLPSELLEPADGISSSTAKAKAYFISQGTTETEWDDMEVDVDKILSNHENSSAREARLIDGVLPALKHIRECGIKTAILTNNSRPAVDIILERIPLANFFEIIQTRHESPTPKPYPGGLWHIYVGDAIIDATAAKRAELEFWGVATGETKLEALEEAGASIVVNSVSDLMPIIDERINKTSS
ncbi:MAG: HAD family hydrolase [Candidatus Thorarchaeota archaeon]|jgi:phosphoglycolate phosphatase